LFTAGGAASLPGVTAGREGNGPMTTAKGNTPSGSGPGLAVSSTNRSFDRRQRMVADSRDRKDHSVVDPNILFLGGGGHSLRIRLGSVHERDRTGGGRS
jgi:hypothetical protein